MVTFVSIETTGKEIESVMIISDYRFTISTCGSLPAWITKALLHWSACPLDINTGSFNWSTTITVIHTIIYKKIKINSTFTDVPLYWQNFPEYVLWHVHSLLLQVPLPPQLLLSQTKGRRRKKREEGREGNRKEREESERERHKHYVLLIKA